MTYKYTEVFSKRTGIAYYVVKSMRGRYFRLVPKSHPAQRSVTYERKDFTKPIEREVC